MMMKPRLIRGIPLSMDMSRLPRGNIWDQTNVCVDSIPFRTHTLLLFLTPWVHISMVTSMFVYLFPDFFFFFPTTGVPQGQPGWGLDCLWQTSNAPAPMPGQSLGRKFTQPSLTQGSSSCSTPHLSGPALSGPFRQVSAKDMASNPE